MIERESSESSQPSGCPKMCCRPYAQWQCDNLNLTPFSHTLTTPTHPPDISESPRQSVPFPLSAQHCTEAHSPPSLLHRVSGTTGNRPTRPCPPETKPLPVVLSPYFLFCVVAFSFSDMLLTCPSVKSAPPGTCCRMNRMHPSNCYEKNENRTA